jgi:hypothetical protein
MPKIQQIEERRMIMGSLVADGRAVNKTKYRIKYEIQRHVSLIKKGTRTFITVPGIADWILQQDLRTDDVIVLKFIETNWLGRCLPHTRYQVSHTKYQNTLRVTKKEIPIK